MELVNKEALENSFIKQSEGIIWKIKLDDEQQTIAWETRNNQKQVSFYTYDFKRKRFLLDNFRFEENWLLGLVGVYHNVAYFHGFENEFSPVQKGIIALDLNNQQILWQNFSVSIQEITKEGVIAFDSKIFPRNYQLLDLKTGTTLQKVVIEQLVSFTNLSNQILIPQIHSNTNIWETWHHLSYLGLEIKSYYQQKDTCYQQLLQIFKNESLIFEDILNTNIQKPNVDTFFVWLNKLVYIRNKSEIVTYLV
ncbi:DUF4905 domain-containing protein [Pelobium sp.]|nr:DUF4905 domain-containing protein [Pelobium sp.]MDA9555328.1 DUF4905 domain-containing protein [Pelobium sp.]